LGLSCQILKRKVKKEKGTARAHFPADFSSGESDGQGTRKGITRLLPEAAARGRRRKRREEKRKQPKAAAYHSNSFSISQCEEAKAAASRSGRGGEGKKGGGGGVFSPFGGGVSQVKKSVGVGAEYAVWWRLK